MKLNNSVKEACLQAFLRLEQILQEDKDIEIKLFYLAFKAYNPKKEELIELHSGSAEDIQDTVATLQLATQRAINQALREEDQENLNQQTHQESEKEVFDILSKLKRPKNMN